MPSWLELSPRRADPSTSLQGSNTAGSRIPPQLQNAVPPCARACLSNYIENQYNNRCTGSGCVCGVYSTSLYSLGELALKCAKGPSCNDQNVSEQAANSAYNLCSQEIGAVPGLYTTLTVLQPSQATSSSTTSSIVPAKATQTSSHTSVTRTSIQLSAAQTAAATLSSSLHPTATSEFAASETATDPTSKERSTLTSAQAVGVAIGAVSGVVIIIAVIYVLSCVRRRKSKKRHAQRQSYDFIDEAPAKDPPSTYENPDSRTPLSELLAPRSKSSSNKHDTVWPSKGCATQRRIAEQAELYGQSGFRNHGRTRSSETVMSNMSMRTVSQLLPERPGSKPPPPPSRPPYAPLMPTPATVFEEERSVPLPRAMLPGLPAHPAVLKIGQPRAQEAIPQPVLSIQIPWQSTRAPSTHSLGDWPLPPPPLRMAPDNDDKLSGCSAAFSSSKTSLLDYYASADSGSSPHNLDSSTPIEEAVQVRRPAPAAIVITKPSYQVKAARDSIASNMSRRTSFESINGDDITPPDEDDKRLSPVAESPISNVRYPRVPRSSNQVVPRSPVYSGTMCPSRAVMVEGDQKSSLHRPSGRGSTLAARRRGEQLEKLHITNSAYNHGSRNNSNSAGTERQLRNQRQQSPLKGYGRTKSQPLVPSYPLTVETTSSGSLKSPLWEPKMTPSRKGDDLYLSVSVATPQDSHFHELYDRR